MELLNTLAGRRESVTNKESLFIEEDAVKYDVNQFMPIPEEIVTTFEYNNTTSFSP